MKFTKRKCMKNWKVNIKQIEKQCDDAWRHKKNQARWKQQKRHLPANHLHQSMVFFIYQRKILTEMANIDLIWSRWWTHFFCGWFYFINRKVRTMTMVSIFLHTLLIDLNSIQDYILFILSNSGTEQTWLLYGLNVVSVENSLTP